MPRVRSRRKSAPTAGSSSKSSSKKVNRKKKTAKSRRRRSATPSRHKKEQEGILSEGQWGGMSGLRSQYENRRTLKDKKSIDEEQQWGGSEGLSPRRLGRAQRQRSRAMKKAHIDSASNFGGSVSKSVCSFLKNLTLFFVVVTIIGFVFDDEEKAKSSGIGVKSATVVDDVSPLCAPINIKARGLTAGAVCTGGRVSTFPTCAFECESDDYNIVGHRYISCTNGEWEAFPTCRLADNVAVAPPRILHETVFPDIDGDGRVNRDEIRDAFGGLGSDGFLASIFGLHDSNKDGHLDVGEYRAATSLLSKSSMGAAQTAAVGFGGLVLLSTVAIVVLSSHSADEKKAKKPKTRRTVRESMKLTRVPSTVITNCTVVAAPTGARNTRVMPVPSAPPMSDAPIEEDPNAGWEEDPNAGWE